MTLAEVILSVLDDVSTEFQVEIPKHNKFLAETIATKVTEHLKQDDSTVQISANINKPSVSADIVANVSLADTLKAILNTQQK